MLAKSAFAIALAAVFLSGCGTNTGDRFVSGGLIGAGTGAAIGAVAGNPGAGALIGGLGGAALGALTRPDQIYLGPSPWRQAGGSPGGSRRCVRYSAATGECLRTARVYPAKSRVARTRARGDVYAANWVESCSRRYRSFDPASGTYRGYDGQRHACR